MSSYEPSQMVSAMARQRSLSTTSPPTSPPVDPKLCAMQDSVKKWYSYGGKRSILAQGIYTYDSTCKDNTSLQTSIVNYSIDVHESRMEGSTGDPAGTAEIRGSIDRNRGTLRFLKSYVRRNKEESLPVWEYSGCFTPCGIVGEWHTPGDPTDRAHLRGKFSIWLREDGDASPEELEDRLRTLTLSGKILTTSMTGAGARS